MRENARRRQLLTQLEELAAQVQARNQDLTAEAADELADRFSREVIEELAAFVEIMRQVGEVVAEIEDEIPAVSRDPKDDYLLAYAVVGETDYLVTGDKDLLVLDSLGSLRINNPTDFAALMEKT